MSKNVIWHPNGDKSISPRTGANYDIQNGSTPPDHFYMRRWLKYPAGFMTSQMGPDSWFAQHEYKTGCSGGALRGRLRINWERNGGNMKYHLIRDNVNNCELPDALVDLAVRTPGVDAPAMPQGSWFYDEVYMRYPTNGLNGVVKYAINGAMVFDYTTTGSTNTLPSLPNRLKLTPGYLNATNVEILVDDLEVLADIPCAAFPCAAPAHID